jgi:predicted GNAT family N-acyltransferase
VKVLRINSSDTHHIRKLLLRSEYPKKECVFEHDDDDLSFHLGGFQEGKLVSIASFYFERHNHFQPENQFRLRGMATLAEYQKQGMGSALLRTAFPMIKQNQAELLWCNARVAAQPFYQKLGFEIHGEQFEIEGVGTHQLMFKEL